MSRWNRPNINQQTMNNIVQTHFNNINMLAQSIQSSQEIIERIQRQNILDNHRTNNITNSIFESIFNEEPFSQTNTRMPQRRRRESQPSRTSNVGTNVRNNNSNATPNTTTRNTTSVASGRTSLLDQTYHYDDDNNIYYFTFDTLGPPVLNNTTNITNTYTPGVSFETLLITEENKDIVNSSDNSSNNVDLSQNTNNYHLYEISHFDLIENPINDVCPITRERFDSTSEHILMIKNCKHIFNKSALNIWLEQHNTCPCCRGHIV